MNFLRAAMAESLALFDRKWFCLAVLALLPIALVGVNDGWLYSPLGWDSDAWFYLGHFQNYDLYVDIFEPNYYVSRLAWIFPGRLLYSVFEPLTANLVLALGVYYLAVFSLYAFLEVWVGHRAAFFGAILFGTHSSVLHAVGWSYLDGAASAYCFASLACACLARGSWRRLGLALAGVLAAAALYTQLYMVFFLPAVPIFYALMVKRSGVSDWKRQAREFLFWAAGGFGALTLLFCVVSWLHGGQFWFYAPSLEFGSKILTENPWKSRGLSFDDYLSRRFLFVPLMGILAAVAYTGRRALRRSGKVFDLTDPGSALVAFFLVTVAVLAGHDLFGTGIALQKNLYTSYVLPSLFCALTVILFPDISTWPRAAFGACCLFVILGMLASYMRLAWVGQLDRFDIVVIVTVIVIVKTLVARDDAWVIVVLAGLMIVQGGWLVRPSMWNFFDYGQDQANVLQAAGELRPCFEDHGSSCGLWFDADDEEYGRYFQSVEAIFLGGFGRFSRSFPDIPSTQSRADSMRFPVILSRFEPDLAAAGSVLEPRGLRIKHVDNRTVVAGNRTFHVAFLELESLSAGAQGENP